MANKIKAGELRVSIPEEEPIWCDRKRWLIVTCPWTFTRYLLTPTKLVVDTGFFNRNEEETRLYRISDISYKQSFWERIGNLGTLILTSNDVSTPVIELKHIKNAKTIREVLSQQIETARKQARVRTSEMVGNFPDGDYDTDSGTLDSDGDGIPDEIDND